LAKNTNSIYRQDKNRNIAQVFLLLPKENKLGFYTMGCKADCVNSATAGANK
jgi:hypothetical protein